MYGFCFRAFRIIFTYNEHLEIIFLFKEYVQFLNKLYNITWFGTVYAVYEKRKLFQSRLCITCSKIEHIPYNWIFTTKFKNSSISITIISWDYMNLSFANEYVGNITIPTQVIKYNQCYSRQISQSDCSIHIKLNFQLQIERSNKTIYRFKCVNLNKHAPWHSKLKTWHDLNVLLFIHTTNDNQQKTHNLHSSTFQHISPEIK